MSFEEYESAVAAGLNLWDWEGGRYPPWFRARVVAWWRLHQAVELHAQDAVSRQIKRQAGRRK